jgi:hypothetical protein
MRSARTTGEAATPLNQALDLRRLRTDLERGGAPWRMASQARQTGRTVNFREEADGMVYEIYLW